MLHFYTFSNLFIDLKSLSNIKRNIIARNRNNLRIMNRPTKKDGNLSRSSPNINDHNPTLLLSLFYNRHTQSNRFKSESNDLQACPLNTQPDVADFGFQTYNNVNTPSHGRSGHTYWIKKLILIINNKLLRNDMNNLMIDIKILDIGPSLLQKPIHIRFINNARLVDTNFRTALNTMHMRSGNGNIDSMNHKR